MLEVRQARYFVAVAEELHFGRAADRLRMSQPPLSQAIQILERQVGARLLHRTSRRVRLTEPGSVLLRHCYLLLAASERASTATAHAQSGQQGSLTLGAVTSAFADPLPSILSRFRETRPRVEVRAHEIDTHGGVQALLDLTLDIALVRYSGRDPRLRTHVLRRDHLLMALPTSHPRAHEPDVEIASMADERWVWIPRAVSPDYHDELISACRRAAFSPVVHHHATSIHSQLMMVACGLGVALVPHTAAAAAAAISYLPLREPYPLVGLALVLRADDPEPLTEQFVDCALSTAEH
ncbi:MAG: LysR family transcriptional regulator [Pseudonocardiales bacterium]|nr:MAG: LysR family transcriptional regulator [Pseudonocardiales bacterium]